MEIVTGESTLRAAPPPLGGGAVLGGTGGFLQSFSGQVPSESALVASGESSVPQWRLSWAAGTDIGLKRADNQDSFLVAPPFFLVADGMGGHAGGKQASATLLHALEPFCGRALSIEKFHRLLATACHEVMDLADANLDYSISPPGTTLTGLVLVNGVLPPVHEAPSGAAPAPPQPPEPPQPPRPPHPPEPPHPPAPPESPAELLVVNVGDSRTYVLAGGQLRQLTRDHSQVAQMLEAGLITPEMVPFMPNRSVITRAIGAGQTTLPQVDTWRLPVAGTAPNTGHNPGNNAKTGAEPGGKTGSENAGNPTGMTGRKPQQLSRETRRFLACSDGLHSLVRQALIERVLADTPTPEAAAKSLIEAALRAGGLDNVTVVVLDIEPAVEMAPHETASDPTKKERE
ncbi:serine/threonine-protein phosphatase [Mobiluncus mulieris]|uniref:Serine/threonine-protein phosphatase n=1 Tax=Mobiluncus mulieris TaxID=2052 RepID=A0A848RGJ7_9ACTO|nr:serine/threonine-protein phosphatase [Mobiluncus mulieris]NMW63003.1 serine/threonine-protein phosphatase [Mobiluncus mulieris]NMW93010.1 serine/threonine-protein phosphatase [Mobiluncus mulieris]PNL42485.1 serine/threonine-protein phosphatase [Mobiluncus mulieris]